MTRTERTRIMVIGVVVPVVIGLAGVIVILIALPDLPDPIAVHWGPSGMPDGFGPAWLSVVLLIVVVGGYSAFALGFARGEGTFTVNQRMILAIGPFLATVMTVLLAGSTLMQRGLESGADAASIGPYVVGGFAGGLATGALAWLLLPASAPLPPLDLENAPVLELGATERAVWMQRIEPQRWLGVFVLGILGLAIIGGGVALWLVAPLPAFTVYVLVLLLVAVLVISTLFWQVRVDETGFRATSAVGVPRFVIPLAQVRGAAVVEVVPVRDFGGWGIRWGGDGRLGVITRGGQAIEVQRTSGKSLVVTVDNAAQAASLLNALKARAVA